MDFTCNHATQMPIPADGGPGTGNTPDPYGRQNGSGQAGQTGGQINPKDVIEAETWLRENDPAIEFGTQELPFLPPLTNERVQRWRNKSGWDGDMRWTPPGFLEEERKREARLDVMNKQKQEIALRHGRIQLSLLQREEEEAEADLYALRARQRRQQGPYPPAPWRR